MATVETVLNAAKYDLQDFGEQEFDTTQLIHYLNRVITLLDRALISMNSDQTLTESTVTLTTGNNSVTVPTSYTVNIREIWDDTQTELSKVNHMKLYEMRMNRYGDSAEPRYWSHIQNNIEFEVNADDDYTFTVYHDIMSTPITSKTDNMPYNSIYDEYLRELLVMMARSKKDKKIAQTDAAYLQIFKNTLYNDMISRGFVPKNYQLDF